MQPVHFSTNSSDALSSANLRQSRALQARDLPERLAQQFFKFVKTLSTTDWNELRGDAGQSENGRLPRSPGQMSLRMYL